ncbi:hypothetical protein D3C75_1325280 [compost metagenome]
MSHGNLRLLELLHVGDLQGHDLAGPAVAVAGRHGGFGLPPGLLHAAHGIEAGAVALQGDLHGQPPGAQ